MERKRDNPLPRTPKEIADMLAFLETQKETCMSVCAFGAALAIGSNIEMLLWAYQMEPERD